MTTTRKRSRTVSGNASGSRDVGRADDPTALMAEAGDFPLLLRREPRLVRHDQHAVAGQMIELLVENDSPGHVALDQALFDRVALSRAEVRSAKVRSTATSATLGQCRYRS